MRARRVAQRAPRVATWALRVAALGLPVVTTLAAAVGPAWSQTQTLDQLDGYVEAARAAWEVPGVAIAVVRDGEVVYARGFGLRRAGIAERVDEHTLFAIGSSTKPMTAAALGMLVDEGRIGWDDAVVDHLPWFRLADPNLTRAIAVRDLVSHRTGVVPAGLLWTGSGYDREEIVRRLRYQEATIPLRSRFLYNNEMFVVAGELIREVTGRSWEEFLHERLFGPLGMRRTNTSVDSLARRSNVAVPHVLTGGETIPVDYRQIDNVGPAGSVNSSVRELAEWMILLLGRGTHGGRRLLEERTVRELQSSQIVWQGPGPDLETRFSTYGLGWFLYDFRGRKVVEHGGAIDGMHALVGMIPEEGIGVAVLTNRLGHRLPYALMYRVFDEFLGEPKTDWSQAMLDRQRAAAARAESRRRERAEAEIVPAAEAGRPRPLDRYAGTYESRLYGTVTIAVEEGRLVFTRPDSSADLDHVRHDVFVARWRSPGLASVLGPTEVRFHIGPLGEVSRFELASFAEFARVADGH